MKIRREARRLARELFGMSLVDGRVDRARATMIADGVLEKKPRHYYGVLKEFSRLLRLELEKRRASVESAADLPQDQAAAVENDLRRKFGDDITVAFRRNPGLIGGIRVQLGSDVWDGSIKSRLDSLRNTL